MAPASVAEKSLYSKLRSLMIKICLAREHLYLMHHNTSSGHVKLKKQTCKYKEKNPNLIAAFAESDTAFSVLLGLLLPLRDDFCFLSIKGSA